MELIEAIPWARNALALARRPEAERIAAAVDAHRVVGLLGEADVGKTETIRQVLLSDPDRIATIHLDLDGAASDEHLGFQLAKEIARVELGVTDLSLLSGRALLPTRVERARIELAELLGVEGLDEALRRWPSGHFPFLRGLRCLEALARRRPTILWLDHLESPALTPRHPVRVDQLLWGIREIVQREPNLRVLLSGREGMRRQVLGPKAAFHQQGMWLSIDNPPAGAWRETAEQMAVSAAVTEHLAEMTGGHPVTMLLALLQLRYEPTLRTAYDTLRDLAARDDGLAGRAIQHARSLHRLGGQVMNQIAVGERPYAASQRGRSSTQEIRKVLERLRLAGLLRPGERWEIVNPLVAIRLRGSVHLMAEPDLPDESA